MNKYDATYEADVIIRFRVRGLKARERAAVVRQVKKIAKKVEVPGENKNIGFVIRRKD